MSVLSHVKIMLYALKECVLGGMRDSGIEKKRKMKKGIENAPSYKGRAFCNPFTIFSFLLQAAVSHFP